MSKKIAFVFPGQGAQKAGMGKDLADSSPAARRTFEEADDALGEKLSTLIFEGPQDQLTLTANTQPAILTVSVAAWRALGERLAIDPRYLAGHSLGEFSALVASGALDFGDAVRLTRARGTFMQQAVPAGLGAMSAVMGKSDQDVTAACAEAAQGEVVTPANFNAPDQIVISGVATAVKRAGDVLSSQGAKVIPLQVSAPFHCALMEPAARGLAGALERVTIRPFTAPVVTNVEALPNRDGARVKDLLVRQVTSPVRWVESVRLMIETGVDLFIELGPGNVLAGLIKRIERDAVTISVNAPAGIDKVMAELQAQP